jgi:uncharacterized protein YbjT (DUF2867 family)
MRVLVLGANGQLGRVVAEKLVIEGHQVRGFARRIPAGEDRLPHAEYFEGDALNENSILKALSGQDVVVNTIGSGTLRKNTVETDTTRLVLKAMIQTPIKKYIAMSAGMVAPVSFVFDHIIRPLFFGNLYREHREVEDLVRASNLDWTIVRPPKLTNRPARGYVESTDARPKGPITFSRSDVAAFISKVIANKLYWHQAVFLTSRKDPHESDAKEHP